MGAGASIGDNLGFAKQERREGRRVDDRVPPNGRAADSRDDRWREFKIAEVRERQFKLDDFKWLKEDSLEDAADLPDPDELAGEAIGELQGAVEELNGILALLGNGGK